MTPSPFIIGALSACNSNLLFMAPCTELLTSPLAHESFLSSSCSNNIYNQEYELTGIKPKTTDQEGSTL